jgi:hypothetical protein
MLAMSVLHPPSLVTSARFYPLSCTPATLLTELLPPGRQANGLILGGDLRKILYTVYSEQGNGKYLICRPRLRPGFQRGYDLTCCDVEPAMSGLTPSNLNFLILQRVPFCFFHFCWTALKKTRQQSSGTSSTISTLIAIQWKRSVRNRKNSSPCWPPWKAGKSAFTEKSCIWSMTRRGTPSASSSPRIPMPQRRNNPSPRISNPPPKTSSARTTTKKTFRRHLPDLSESWPPILRPLQVFTCSNSGSTASLTFVIAPRLRSVIRCLSTRVSPETSLPSIPEATRLQYTLFLPTFRRTCRRSRPFIKQAPSHSLMSRTLSKELLRGRGNNFRLGSRLFNTLSNKVATSSYDMLSQILSHSALLFNNVTRLCTSNFPFYCRVPGRAKHFVSLTIAIPVPPNSTLSIHLPSSTTSALSTSSSQ